MMFVLYQVNIHASNLTFVKNKDN